MAVKLQRQFDIAVAEQSLDGFRIGSNAHQERGQTVAKVVETESAWIILHESPVFVPMRRKNSCLSCGWPQIIFDEHICHARLFAFQAKRRKDPSADFGYAVFPFQWVMNSASNRWSGTGPFDALVLGKPI